MHHVVVPEHPSQFRARQRGQNRHRAGHGGPKSGPLRLAAIGGLQHKPRGMASHPIARFFETRDGLTRAPGHAEIVSDPPDQRRLQHERKIGGNQDRTACRAGHRPKQLPAFRAPAFRVGSCPSRAFYHIPGGTQPYSPSRQLPGEIRDQGAIGTDDKSEHKLLRQTRARDRAAAQGPCFRLFGVRVNRGVAVFVGKVSRDPSPRPLFRLLPRPRTNGRERP